MTAWLEVVDAGPSTTVQDRGRPGHGHEGVPPSGALDQPAYARANRLVGNREGDAVLETTWRGPVLRVAGTGLVHVALTGAPAPLLVDGRPVPLDAPVAVRAGSHLEVGVCAAGVRSYLAFAGGLDTPVTLASRSTDVLSGLGPAVLAAGDVLALGPPGAVPAVDLAPPPGHGPPVLALVPGPRLDHLAPAAVAALTAADWEVASTSNRVGLRLLGPPLPWARPGELAPEGIVTGGVQVPPAGGPIVFLNDHPVTGGYPVVAVLREASLPLAAQARPGTTLRLAGPGPLTPRR